jgi:hypothetical protein
LANNAVTSVKIKDGTIVEADLANNAVTTGKIKDGTIVGSDINNATDLTAANFFYHSPKTRYWSIAGSDFAPRDETHTYTKVSNYLTSTIYTFTTPVHLPHGARVTKTRVYYWDSSAANDFNVRLSRVTLATIYISEMALVTTSSAFSGWRTGEDTSISDATIDNNQYAYQLYLYNMNGTTNHRLGGVVIEYTVPNPLP